MHITTATDLFAHHNADGAVRIMPSEFSRAKAHIEAYLRDIEHPEVEDNMRL